MEVMIHSDDGEHYVACILIGGHRGHPSALIDADIHIKTRNGLIRVDDYVAREDLVRLRDDLESLLHGDSEEAAIATVDNGVQLSFRCAAAGYALIGKARHCRGSFVPPAVDGPLPERAATQLYKFSFSVGRHRLQSAVLQLNGVIEELETGKMDEGI